MFIPRSVASQRKGAQQKSHQPPSHSQRIQSTISKGTVSNVTLPPFHEPVRVATQHDFSLVVAPPQLAPPLQASPPQAPPTTYSSERLISKITAYHDAPRIAVMGSHEVQLLQTNNKIHVQAKHAPKPILSFDDCGLPPTMHINILQSGCYEPTPVQMQAIPAGLSGQDVVITAPTGSGKTASYLIPTLVHAYGLAQVYTNRASRVTLDVGEGDESQESSSSEHMGPYVIILVPTHELAAQVEEQAKIFVKGLQHMRTANLSGSLPIKTQVYRLRQNIQIAVATPGRLIDIFFRYPEFSFSNVYSIVLDEVDVMYSLGFEQQVQRVLDIIPEPTGGRQTIVCSATFPKKTEKSIQHILRNPIRIRVGDPALGEEASASDENEDASGDSSNSGLMPSASVRQTVLWVENVSKKKKLFSILRDRKYFRPPILIFVESRLGAQLLAKAITVKCPSVKATFMHGENTPTERAAAISGFKDGSFDVMVATGLLARGLDLGVPLVINFDMAPTIEEYIHRIGRANIGMARHYAQQQHKDQGRRQIIGPKMDMAWAITFINHDHDRLLFEFANMLNKLPFGRITPMPPQLLQYVVHTPAKRSIAIKSSKSHDASDPPKTTLSKGVLAGASMGKNDKGGVDMMKPSNMPQGMKRKRRKRSSTLPAKKTKLKE